MTLYYAPAHAPAIGQLKLPTLRQGWHALVGKFRLRTAAPQPGPAPEDEGQRQLTMFLAVHARRLLATNLEMPVRLGDRLHHLALEAHSVPLAAGSIIAGGIPERGFYSVSPELLRENFWVTTGAKEDFHELSQATLAISMRVIGRAKRLLERGQGVAVVSRFPRPELGPLPYQSACYAADGVAVAIRTRPAGDSHYLCSVDFLCGVGPLTDYYADGAD